MRKHAATVERSTGAGRCWYTNASGGPPTPVDVSVTPKPHYGIDGNKVFGITGTPDGYTDAVFAHKRLSIIDVASSHEPLPFLLEAMEETLGAACA